MGKYIVGITGASGDVYKRQAWSMDAYAGRRESFWISLTPCGRILYRFLEKHLCNMLKKSPLYCKITIFFCWNIDFCSWIDIIGE